MPESTQTKKCCRCKAEKLLDDFHRDKRRSDGRTPQCKACLKAARASETLDQRTARNQRDARSMAKARAANPEKFRQAQREFKAANPEKIRGYREAFDARHPERKAEIQRRFREANRDRIAERKRIEHENDPTRARERTRQWAKDNPERVHERRVRRRAQEVAVGPIDLGALWTGACALCGLAIDAELRWPDPLSKSVDHIVPLSKGGTHEQGNLQWAHLRCNMRKGSRSP